MGFYVVSDDKCFYEGMTKEQILSAITQAISTHQISDVDTGFVTTLKEANQNKPMSFWVGTTAEYNAIEEKLDDCVYLLTDDTELEDLEALIRRSMNVLKGEVIIDKSSDPIAFSGNSSLSIPLTGEHEIWDFTLVEVITSLNDHVLCTVMPIINAQTNEMVGANITGIAPVCIQFNDPTDPIIVHETVSIRCYQWTSGTATQIIGNFSTQYPIHDSSGTYSAQGLSIKKIVGVM